MRARSSVSRNVSSSEPIMLSGVLQVNPRWRRRAWCVAIGVTVISALACEDALAPRMGAVQVTIATNGNDVDSDGYVLVIDTEPIRTTGTNGSSWIGALTFGRHEVVLTGVAENCIVVGGARRDVTISETHAIPVSYQVECERAGVEVSVTASGADLDLDGYTVSIDDEAASYVGSNQPVVISRIRAGKHVIRLDGLAPNCRVDGANPLVVTTAARGLMPVAFSVTCTLYTGTLEILVTTTGTDLDFDGYLLRVDDGAAVGLAVQATTRLWRVPGGTHTIRIQSIAPNCTAAGNPRVVNLAIGDTALVQFQVTCGRAEKIAFSRAGSSTILVVYEDGSNALHVAGGDDASWSPDGQKLVYAAVACDLWYYYYYYECYHTGIATADGDGRNARSLTTGHDRNPAWSSDGQRVAFDREENGRVSLHVVSGSGGATTPLVLPSTVIRSSNPSWSPDGTRMAFTCLMDSDDICVVNRDGSGFARLTSDEASDFGPDWSPDGTRIAFTTTRFGGRVRIATMNVDGSEVTPLAEGTEPDWSRDGSRIVFAGPGLNPGVYVMRADGANAVRIVSEGTARAPSWRP
jgi:hypothetical protein